MKSLVALRGALATPSPACLISALQAQEMVSDLDGHASEQ